MMIRVLTPETDPRNRTQPDVFLAGGITGCPDWQAEAIAILQDRAATDLCVANPRRARPIPPEGPEAMGQISWEWQHLATAPVIVFWFAQDQVQPIALFELGKALGRRQRVVVGVHPHYPRRFDVVVQAALERSDCVVYDSLEDVLAATLAQLELAGICA